MVKIEHTGGNQQPSLLGLRPAWADDSRGINMSEMIELLQSFEAARTGLAGR